MRKNNNGRREEWWRLSWHIKLMHIKNYNEIVKKCLRFSSCFHKKKIIIIKCGGSSEFADFFSICSTTWTLNYFWEYKREKRNEKSFSSHNFFGLFHKNGKISFILKVLCFFVSFSSLCSDIVIKTSSCEWKNMRKNREKDCVRVNFSMRRKISCENFHFPFFPSFFMKMTNELIKF